MMCEVVRRFLSCMNKKEEDRIKDTPRIKQYKDAPRHIGKRIEAVPNTYIKDNRHRVEGNESLVPVSTPIASTLGPRSASLVLQRNQFGNLLPPNNLKSKSFDMGKVDTMAFDNLSMLGYNSNNFTPASWKTEPATLSTLSTFVGENSIKDIANSARDPPSHEYAINTLLSCTPSQRYTGLPPLIPNPKRVGQGNVSAIVTRDKHQYVNTHTSANVPLWPSHDEESDRDWGWLSLGGKNSEPKKQKLSKHGSPDAIENNDIESKVVESFVSPGGVVVFIKSTENNEFKTESWKHMVALLGGGKVTFTLPQSKEDQINMPPRKQEDNLRQNGFQAMPNDANNYFNISKKAYYKLISYCQANKLNLKEDFVPEYCKNRARLSARNQKKETDFKRLLRVLETVEECAWYWGCLSGNDAKRVLNNTPPGTFLLRDSSDPRYLYSLSIKTSKGPTSIRIVYKDNTFQFDSDMEQNSSCRNRQEHSKLPPDHPNYVAKRKAPVCDCVIGMILRYTKHNRTHRSKPNNVTPMASEVDPPPPEQFMCYYVSRAGRQEIPVILSKPLPKRPPTLQELCRLNVSKQMNLWKDKKKIEELPLPVSMKKFVIAYPYPA